MSQTFSLVCRETQQYLWIGQGHGGTMEVFYSGAKDVIKNLPKFLNATKGLPLLFCCDDLEEFYDDYAEFGEINEEDKVK